LNDSVCRITEYSREELEGTNYQKYIEPELASSIYNTFNRVYQTGRPSKSAGWRFRLIRWSPWKNWLIAWPIAPPAGDWIFRINILMVTSYSDRDTVLNCVQAGCDGYIFKPFNFTTLMDKLESLGLA
jgi:PAS domain-containing protein